MKLKVREALERKWGWVGKFSKGLAAVRKNGEWFHIGWDGKPAYKERYAWVGYFFDDLADATDKDGNYFQIRRNGQKKMVGVPV